MTYQWRAGDFRTMAGRLPPAFEPANLPMLRRNGRDRWDQELRRVKGVSALPLRAARFAARG
jgi:hypothetical protein